jgi:predicted metal-dependent hydrolase
MSVSHLALEQLAAVLAKVALRHDDEWFSGAGTILACPARPHFSGACIEGGIQ